MDKNKWLTCLRTNEHARDTHIRTIAVAPENWGKVKEACQKFIVEMDEATEVYTLENGKKNDNTSH